MAELVSAIRRPGRRDRACRRRGQARRCARRICPAPSAQFKPTDNGAACAIEFQNASGVCPESSGADRSVIVPGHHDRQTDAELFDDVRLQAGLAALAFGVSKMVSMSRISTPPSVVTPLLGVSDAQLIERDSVEAWIENVRRDRGGAVGRADATGDEVRGLVVLVRSSLRHAWRASLAPSGLSS